MEPSGPLIYRRSTLTNSAAEFVERGRGMGALMQADSVEDADNLRNRSEFIEEIDQFASKGLVFDIAKYYEESQKSMLRFRQTLQRLVTTLQERNVDKELNIEIKDPGSTGFTFEYVLGITNQLQESRENGLHTRTCKTFIRRCYRKVEGNRGAIEGILGMVPNDAYGSIISGGFTLIMAAVEKHASQREAIQKWLATIPETLEGIQRFSELHRKSPRLHKCANGVLVAMFFVLERIVDKLTQSWRDRLGVSSKQASERAEKLKGIFKSKSSAVVAFDSSTLTTTTAKDDGIDEKKSVDEALSDFKTEIERFQKEVDICGQERLGRIENDTTDIRFGTLVMAKEVRAMNHSITKMQMFMQDQKMLKTEDKAGEAQAVQQNVLLQLQNLFYKLCASNPHFDSKTGGIDHQELQRSASEKSDMSLRSYREENKATKSRWVASHQAPSPAHMSDIRDCLDHLSMLSPDGRDIASWILASNELQAWTEDPKSSIITVDLQTPPSDLSNPLSLVSASLASVFFAAETAPVLCFFCKHRNNESPDEKKSGATAMLNNLNHQLIKFITKRRENVDLEVIEELEDDKACEKSRKYVDDGLALLESLLWALPAGEHVYIILDCLSSLSGREKDGNSVVRRILRVMKKRSDLVIKLWVTDPSADSKVREASRYEVSVPDSVGGSGMFDIAEAAGRIAAMK